MELSFKKYPKVYLKTSQMEFAFGKIADFSPVIFFYLNIHSAMVFFRFIFRYFRKFVRIFSDLFVSIDFTVLNLRDTSATTKNLLKINLGKIARLV